MSMSLSADWGSTWVARHRVTVLRTRNWILTDLNFAANPSEFLPRVAALDGDVGSEAEFG